MDKNGVGLPGNDEDALRDRVYKYLREEMERGRLFPGASIKVNTLCEKLKISKPPLRDALLRLEAEGLVTIHPRSGISISSLKLDDIRFLYEAISAVEGSVLDTIFDKFQNTHYKMMKDLNVEMRSAITGGDYVAYTHPHWKFHNIFMELSGNTVARRLVNPIKYRLWGFPRRRYHQEWELMACDEHEAIAKAIKEKNKAEAIHVLRERHWNFGYNEKYIRWVYFPED
jgi:DNA-binding GntR family transcriptional regulator